MKIHKQSFRRLIFSVCLLLAVSSGSLVAATFVMGTNGDASSYSSFNTSLNWDGTDAAPSPGNHYQVNWRTIRTPLGSDDHAFQGDSLTIVSGDSIAAGMLAITGSGLITVNDLRLTSSPTQPGPSIRNYLNDTTAVRLAGNITVTGYAVFGRSASNSRQINVSATIKGAGGVRIVNDIVTFSATNTYSGGTFVMMDSGHTGTAHLIVESGGSLGTGDVTLNAGTRLTLQGANAIADTASLFLDTGLAAGSVSLSFSGTEIIGGLQFGANQIADGAYTASALNALLADSYGAVAIFSGPGTLQIGAIPEPSSVALLASLVAFGMVFIIHRKC